jgi:hypothetical protein
MRLSRPFTAIALAVAGLLGTGSAMADSWRFPATVNTRIEENGDVAIKRIIDGRKNQRSPDFRVEVWRGKELLARFPGVYFEKLFAAPDGSFFVGLSNDGLFGTAVVIIDRGGYLQMEAKHGPAKFDYCNESITRVREWVDLDRPRVSFEKHEPWGYKVKLRTCRGEDADLIRTVQDAYSRSSQGNASNVR